MTSSVKPPDSETDFRQIFDACPDPIAITRIADGRIVLVNPEFVRLSGYSIAESVGRLPDELGVWPDPKMREYCAGVLHANGLMRNFGMTFRGREGGQMTFLLSGAEFNLGGEPCRLAIGRDITDIRRIQGELVAARDAAEAASRAKSEFLSGMSHEIRAPLNAILGMADLLTETALDAQQQKYLGLMHDNGQAMLRLINDLLDLARIESGRLSLEQAAFDLGELALGVIDTLGVRARERALALDLRLDAAVSCALTGDPLRLRQVLLNLIGNAIKFTERGGVTLTIDHQLSAIDDDTGGAAAERTRLLHFAVTDTGAGIPEDKLQDIFNSFTQADSSIARRFGGSGLGLTIVKRLVAMMGGRIWVESRVGLGSTFHFTARFEVRPAEIEAPFASGTSASAAAPPLAAPAAADTAGAAAAAATPAAAASAPAPRVDAPMRVRDILITDDSSDNRFLLRAYFKKSACRLEEAENGEVALRKFIAGRFDIVLMDMQMPVMDGYAAVRRMREWERERGLVRTPIIALTASALREDIARCLEAGCDLHVAKPISKITLFAAIDRVVPAPAAAASADSSARAPT